MPNGPKDYLKLGDWNSYCDSCSFKFKASELKKDWKGFMKCPTCWDARHPMDLQQSPRASKALPWTRSNDEKATTTNIDGGAIPGSPSTSQIDSIPAGTFTTNNTTL